MNNLLIFFAIPLSTIILSAIFETIIESPIKVAGIAFSIFLIVAFSLGGSAEFIVAAIIYTLLSLITSFITKIIQSRIECFYEDDCDEGSYSSVNKKESIGTYKDLINTNEFYYNKDNYSNRELNDINNDYYTRDIYNSNYYSTNGNSSCRKCKK